MQDLVPLLQKCEDDTRRFLGHLAAERIGNWRRHTASEAALVEYIQRLLWEEHCENGKKLERRGGLSLERIVLDHRPDLFTEGDLQQARRTLEIAS